MRLARDRARFGATVRDFQYLDSRPAFVGAKQLGQAALVVCDEGRGRGNNAPRASPVAAESDRACPRNAGQKSLEARPRGAAEAVDRLGVIAHGERSPAAGDKLDQTFL